MTLTPPIKSLFI